RQELEKRIVRLEEWTMHTDHLLKSLNEVLCRVQDRLDAQDRKLALLTATVQRAAYGDGGADTPESERPPHY
ncbi:MAG: SlyX family protein, partial [Planctomycetes bacterium]|nr:SlyX family protein [Planctomycetota bacterium]